MSDPGLLEPGARVGKYELERRLAIGGMAEIYLARVTGIEGFEKQVVLKRILPQYAANEEFIAMFLDEARLAATLHHPNIAQVYDIGISGGSYFFTMEYVRGEDLREILRAAHKARRGIPMEHSLQAIIGVCAGLHAAHEKTGLDGESFGIVHRDVSPSNVLVSLDGNIKVVDFGIAKATSRQAETRAGTLKGKVSYMSPEQCRGEDLDRRSDVFSIGILLYELTTGRKLFRGDNDFAILSRIVHEDVLPPSELQPDYPIALEAIVLRALSRERDMRFQTAEELQLALEQFARDERLETSSVKLGAFVRELFAHKIAAERAGSAPRRKPATPPVALLVDLAPDESGEIAVESPALPSITQADVPSIAFLEAPSEKPAWLRPAALVAVGVLVLCAGIALGVGLTRPDRVESAAVPSAAHDTDPPTPRWGGSVEGEVANGGSEGGGERAGEGEGERAGEGEREGEGEGESERAGEGEGEGDRASGAKGEMANSKGLETAPAGVKTSRHQPRGDEPEAAKSAAPVKAAEPAWDPDSPLPPP